MSSLLQMTWICCSLCAGMHPDTPDLVCGPRCVQFVLNHYGVKCELINLVREIQWPNYENGASVEDLRKALETHGVYTRAVHVEGQLALAWQHPVVVCLRPLHDTSDVGHFVVWLPSSNGEPEMIWDGLDGVMSLERGELPLNRMGTILLTSPEPILTLEGVVRRGFWVQYQRMIVFSGLVIVTIALVMKFGRSIKLCLAERGNSATSP